MSYAEYIKDIPIKTVFQSGISRSDQMGTFNNWKKIKNRNQEQHPLSENIIPEL